MPSQNITALTNYAGGQSPADLVYVAKSPFGSTDDRKSTLNDLFAYPTKNITDETLRFQASSSPTVSAASEGALTFNGTNFQISENGGAYQDIGNIRTAGLTATRIPIASASNTLVDDDGLSYNTTTNFLSVGATSGGGIFFLGTSGFSVALAAQAPAATHLYYLPNAAPTAGQFLYAATTGAQTQLGWQTAPSGSGSANQVAVWGASNALTGSSSLTFSSSVLSALGAVNGDSGFFINQTTSGTAAQAGSFLQTTTSAGVWALTSALFTASGLRKANQLYTLGGAGTVEMLFQLADASTRFVYGVNGVEAASINATASLGLVLGAASTLTGRVRMYNSAGTTYTQLSAGNAAASLNYILPATSPTAGQVLSASAPSGSDVTLSWTTAGGSSSLTATQVGFGSGANALTGSADLIYLDATGVFDLTKTLNSSVRYTVANLSNGAAAQARFGITNDAGNGAALISYSSGFTTSGLRVANSAVLDLDGPVSLIIGQAAGRLSFALGATEYARLTPTVLSLFGAISGSNTGLTITSAASGSGLTLAVAGGGTNENRIDKAKGTGIIRIVPDTAGAGTVVIGASTDTADAQLSVYSQSTTRPGLKLRALSGTSSSQTVFESYNASGTLSGAITSGGAFLARGALDYTNPEYSFSTDTNTGMAWRSADVFSLVAGGSEIVRITGAAADALGSTIGASSGGKLGLGNGGGFDVLLERDAANTLALRNSTNAQTFRFYGTYADASNYVRGSLSATSSLVTLASETAGTGADNIPLALLPAGTSPIQFLAPSGAVATQRVFTVLNASSVDVGGWTAGGSIVQTNLGTAPTVSVTNACLTYVADVAAANAELFCRDENGEITRLTGVTRVLDQDFPATTTTLADITGAGIYGSLTFNVEASKPYQFRAVLFVDADATGGWKVTMAGTATATAVRWHVLGFGVTAGLINNTQWAALGSGSAATGNGVTTYKIEIDGYLLVNAAGTLTVQFAQNSASATSYVKQGSFFTILQGN